MLKHGQNTIESIPGIISVVAKGDVVFHKLPATYTEATYVRSNTNSYFTTNLYLDSESEVISDVQFENAAGNTYGCYSGSSSEDNFCLYAGSSSTNAYIRYNGEVKRAFAAMNGERYKLVHNKNGFWANDTQYVQAFNDAIFTCSAPFTVGNLSNSTATKFKGRIYRLTIKKSGNVVMDLIPAQNSNDEYGLYDIIGLRFYTSEGSAFTGA